MNIILVVMDSVREDHFRPPLPDATRFLDAYSAGCWTVPSAASLLTGMWPQDARAAGLEQDEAAEPLTLADYLSRQGYTCEASWLPSYAHMRRGFGMWADIERDDDNAHVMRAIKRIQSGGDHQFIVLWLFAGHWPYQGLAAIDYPSQVRDFVRRGMPPARPDPPISRAPRIVEQTTQGEPNGREQPEITAEELRVLKEQYREACGATVDRVSAVWREASAHNWAVLVTADHGEQFLEHGEMGHTALAPENIRVPLYARIPDLAPGMRSGIASHVDVAATVMVLGGAGIPAGIPGCDLRETPAARDVYVETGWGLAPDARVTIAADSAAPDARHIEALKAVGYVD
jgi:arylsulfatase A-like enzyme